MAASDVEWFLTYVTKPIIFRWLAIQFSETDPAGSFLVGGLEAQ
jgi:hypothetical protein